MRLEDKKGRERRRRRGREGGREGGRRAVRLEEKKRRERRRRRGREGGREGYVRIHYFIIMFLYYNIIKFLNQDFKKHYVYIIYNIIIL